MSLRMAKGMADVLSKADDPRPRHDIGLRISGGKVTGGSGKKSEGKGAEGGKVSGGGKKTGGLRREELLSVAADADKLVDIKAGGEREAAKKISELAAKLSGVKGTKEDLGYARENLADAKKMLAGGDPAQAGGARVTLGNAALNVAAAARFASEGGKDRDSKADGAAAYATPEGQKVKAVSRIVDREAGKIDALMERYGSGDLSNLSGEATDRERTKIFDSVSTMVSQMDEGVKAARAAAKAAKLPKDDQVALDEAADDVQGWKDELRGAKGNQTNMDEALAGGLKEFMNRHGSVLEAIQQTIEDTAGRRGTKKSLDESSTVTPEQRLASTLGLSKYEDKGK